MYSPTDTYVSNNYRIQREEYQRRRANHKGKITVPEIFATHAETMSMEARRVSEGAFVGLAFGLSVLLAGCGGSSLQPTPAPSPVTKPVTWIEKDIEHEGMNILLGHRDQEPIAAITRDGQPVVNAMVFCTLLPGAGEPIGEEAATVYEPPLAKDPGLYSAGKLKMPADNSQSRLRFRIVLPEIEPEWSRDIDIPVK